ncbi:hypothetical protein ABZ725_43145 [Streptomyces sp. NPDC006872]|uniref:hypothetical protein n=1 Tax=Streptomyces sp. NPDC006872 TaxID=3155720 RepID=UPI0033D9808E
MTPPGPVEEETVKEETAEQNRYWRAMCALPAVSREPATAGYADFWDVTEKILKEHRPLMVPNPLARDAPSAGRARWLSPP